jgi:uncharacterized protein (TIGR00255 family)
MIRSMTGFGAGKGGEGGEAVEAEIRSVNHKFCEVKVRLPRELGALETEITRWVKDRLARGGIDVSIRRSSSRAALSPRVDADLAAEYARAFEDVRTRLGLAGGVALSDVLAAAGVVTLEERSVDVEAARGSVAAAIASALEGLLSMREREGVALARDLEGRLAVVEAIAARLAEAAPRTLESYRVRLEERVAELSRGLAPDPVRLATEVALFADRTDVTEELTRLASHVAQMRALLASGEPAGRKMDFLVQEMHREANTVGSKSQSAEAAAAVVNLKAEIERMREQVQNVE